MASYEDLRKYFDESKLLQQAVRSAAEIPIVTGFTLDIDPWWSYSYDVENDLVDRTQTPPWRSDPRFFRSDGEPRNVLLPPDRGYRRRDLHKPIPGWEKRLPIVLTVVHRPLRASQEGDTGLLQQLVRAMREAGAAVRIEERPPARLALASGDQITVSPAASGTLGGVLKDQAGASYGITCAHVAQTNDDIYDAANNKIGVCTADTARVPLASHQVCDPVNLAAPSPSPGNGPDLNMLDCALMKLSAKVAHPSIAGVAPALSPGQSVTVTGAVTGTTRHWLGSLCLSYGFASGGQTFCFRDSIELVPQPSGVLGRTIVPTQGDSGSWVLTDDQPPEWAGLFFGEDGKRGFAVRAKWVHDWAFSRPSRGFRGKRLDLFDWMNEARRAD
jgi:hypothetical protein